MDARSLAGLALEPRDVTVDPEQRSRRCGAWRTFVSPARATPKVREATSMSASRSNPIRRADSPALPPMLSPCSPTLRSR